MIQRFCYTVAAIGLLFACLIGCGKEPSGSIRGSVRFEKEPVQFGTVAIVSEQDGAVRQAMIVDGEYQLDEVPLGQARIAVSAHAAPRSVRPPTAEEGSVEPSRATHIAPIPARFGDAKHSGLTIEVIAGEQQHDLDLKRGY